MLKIVHSSMTATERYDGIHKEQPSFSTSRPLPASMPRPGLQQEPRQSSARSLFSLDENVVVAFNLSTSIHSQHRHPHHQNTGPRRLSTVHEKPTQMGNASEGDRDLRRPPRRYYDVDSYDSALRVPEGDSEEPSSQTDKQGNVSLIPIYNKAMDKHDLDPNDAHPSLEYPPLYFLVKQWPWLHESIRSLYTFRWRLSYPLQRRIPCSRCLETLGIYLTWGELLLLLPFFGLIVVGTLWSFLFPSPTITGQVSRLPLIFAFATAMHNSFLTLLLGIPFERALWYHKLAGRIAFVNGILHTYVCYFIPNNDHVISTHVKFEKYMIYDRENISGTAILFLVTGMLITSVPYIRHKFFELFFYIHILFAAAMTGCAFFHSGKLVPILVASTWGVDLIIRKLIMAVVRYPKKARVRIISESVVELRFPKMNGFDFNPGQYVYLCIPELSLLEWHPFSISSSPGQKTVSFHIRKAGGWTAALHDLAQTRDEVSILLEGPYGSVGVDLMSNRYSSVLLVSGGIGITPMQSICNQLIYEHSTGQRSLKQLSFVWMERDPIVLSDVDVVRRSGSMHFNNKNAMDAISAYYDDDDDDGPMDIASTILSLVPLPSTSKGVDTSRKAMTSDADKKPLVSEESSISHVEQSQEDFSVVSIHGDAQEMCAMSFLSDEPTLMEQGKSPKFGKLSRDDDTFLGAAFHRTSTRSPIDVLDMQVYLTSKDVMSGVKDLPFVYQGRPDIDRMFLKLREGALASDESRVAVCVCAPLKIVNICQSACIKYSDARVRFDFHAETFT